MSGCLSGFPCACCFGLFGDAYFSRYSRMVCMFRTDKWHVWRCDGCGLKSTQVSELSGVFKGIAVSTY